MKQDILVITPTLGNRDSLSKTIQSVKEIGGNRVKHILIAPSSIISSLKEKYQIDCLPEPNNKKGIYAALNHGLNTYKKEFKYMTFINDDDFWLPDFYTLIDRITNNNLDFVYGKICFVNDKGNPLHKQMACSSRFKDFIPLLYSNIVLFTQQATLIRSELFDKIGGFDERYKLIADSKFWAQLSLLKIKYHYVAKRCAAYTIQTGQLSSDKSLQCKEHLQLLKEVPAVSQLSITKAKYIFRIQNIKTYLTRL